MLPVKFFMWPSKKGFFLCGPSVALYTMRNGPLVVRRLMCAAGTVFANVTLALRSLDEEGRGLYISCAGHFSFLIASSIVVTILG